MNYQPTVQQLESNGRDADLGPETALSVSDLLKVGRRRLALIVGTIVVVSGLGALVTFQLTPKFRAEAVLILDSQSQRVTNVQDVMSSLSTESSVLRSELDVLLSRPLASKVIDKLNLMSDPEFNPALKPPNALVGPLFFWLDDSGQRSIDTWLRAVFHPSDQNAGKTRQQIDQDARTVVVNNYLRKLAVTTDGRSLTMKIAVETTRPELSAQIVNTHGDLYLLDQLDAKFEATKRANSWLTERVSDLKEQVRKAENAVEEYRQKYQIVSSDRGATVVSQQLAELNSQLVVARTERNQADARLKQVRALLKSNASVDALPEVLGSSTILQLRAQEGQLVQTESQLSTQYKSNYPSLINARGQLRDVRAQIRNEINKVVSSLEQGVDSALNKERSLQSAVDDLTTKVSQMGVSEVHLRELEREADASRTLFENFLGRFKETSAGPSVETSDARVVSPADPPLSPSFPKKNIFLPAFVILGVVIAFALTALLEILDNGFRSSDQIEKLCGISGLGMVPNLPLRALSGVLPGEFVTKKPLSSFAEAVRAIRTSLFYSNIDAPPKVILVTSAVPAEGKTLLSVSLARSAAMSGHKTLLFDADFRRPAVATALAASAADTTVSDYFGGIVDIDRLIRRDELTSLEYVAAPSGMTNPLDLLSSVHFDKMLDQFRETYEFVFIDSPPVLAVADTLAIARLVDAVVFSVRWEKTPRAIVLGALKTLRGTGAIIAGTVLSRVNVRRHMRYGYGDGGYYYGRYGGYYTK